MQSVTGSSPASVWYFYQYYIPFTTPFRSPSPSIRPHHRPTKVLEDRQDNVKRLTTFKITMMFLERNLQWKQSPCKILVEEKVEIVFQQVHVFAPLDIGRVSGKVLISELFTCELLNLVCLCISHVNNSISGRWVPWWRWKYSQWFVYDIDADGFNILGLDKDVSLNVVNK